MKARSLIRRRVAVGHGMFADLVVWELPQPLAGSEHPFKYRLAFVMDGRCVLRYDNETGKGDHRHIGEKEHPYSFTTPDQLMADFFKDIQQVKR